MTLSSYLAVLHLVTSLLYCISSLSGVTFFHFFLSANVFYALNIYIYISVKVNSSICLQRPSF